MIEGYSDADWAGCKVTRRSTSGGFVKVGPHNVKHWSRIQQCVSLSSAEAELYALVKCATEAIGIQTLLADWGISVGIRLYTDASAAKSILMRQGIGRTKHIDVQSLWLQERVAGGELTVEKIPRERNGADLLTHHWRPEEGLRHLPRAATFPYEV